ncbi:MAG: DUF4197 domain-containing protein [Sterolibacterium sp.]
MSSPTIAIKRCLRILLLGVALGMTAVLPARADLASLSGKDATSGLKEALTRGAEFAVSHLGKPDGFLGNAKVRIPLPKSLQKVEGMARKLGLSKQADDLADTMNRAAESAVVEAKPLLVDAVKKMSIKDAKGILVGPEDSATQYFRTATSAQLAQKFLPIVKKATARVQLADKYNAFAGKAAKLKLIDEKDADLDNYVTQKAIDGLFLMVAEQEKQIRQDPVGTGSNLLKKVFGVLGK